MTALLMAYDCTLNSCSGIIMYSAISLLTGTIFATYTPLENFAKAPFKTKSVS